MSEVRKKLENLMNEQNEWYKPTKFNYDFVDKDYIKPNVNKNQVVSSQINILSTFDDIKLIEFYNRVKYEMIHYSKYHMMHPGLQWFETNPMIKTKDEFSEFGEVYCAIVIELKKRDLKFNVYNK